MPTRSTGGSASAARSTSPPTATTGSPPRGSTASRPSTTSRVTTGRGPRLHHFAFTAEDRLAIVAFCDALAGGRLEDCIERGPGRHGVSNAFFVYLRDPDGHRIELYVCDYYTGDPDHEPIRWSASDPRRRAFWSHHVPDSWFEEGTLVRGADGRPAALAEPLLDERLIAAE